MGSIQLLLQYVASNSLDETKLMLSSVSKNIFVAHLKMSMVLSFFG